MNNPEKLLENSKSIGKRIKSLKQREVQLASLSEEQNELFEKLRQGYKYLGIIDNSYDDEDITQQLFKSYIIRIEEDYQNSKNGNKDDELRNFEQYISSKISLLGNRWNSICQYKKLWFAELGKLRNSEEELIGKQYINLEKLVGKISDSEWKTNAENIFHKHGEIVVEQQKHILALEKQQNELESIYREREELHELAVEQFLK